MKTYRTRYSIGLVLLLVFVAITILIPILFTTGWEKILVELVSLTIYLVIALGAMIIRYTIDEQSRQLIISTFFGLGNSRIDITQITSIHKTRCLLSSPAASLKRIRIEDRDSRFTEQAIISPYAQDEFLAELKKINPNIKIDERLLQA